MRDLHGRVRWRVRVTRGEMTCLHCGEVADKQRCPRCSLDEQGRANASRTRLIPTVGYLREGEYELA